MEALRQFKEQFEAREGIHFNSAGQSPVSRRVRDRVQEVNEGQWRRASFRDPDLVAGVARARRTMAAFLGAEPEQVAFQPNVATALSQAALGFPLGPRDAVVTIDQEYSSSFIPWREACRRSGAELRVFQSGSDGRISLPRLLEQIREPVKVVAVSWVQFQTGEILDLRALGEHCRRVGAYLVVDGIQGLGQLPFSFRDLPVDLIAGAAHKWMCSTLGQAFFAGTDEFLSRLSPLSVGAGTYNDWGAVATSGKPAESSARRFEAGGLSFTALFGLEAAAELLMETGLELVSTEIQGISRILREGILDLGIELATPMRQPGGITSVRLDEAHENRFLGVCREKRIALAKRGPFVRFSPHAFCSQEETELLLSVLRETHP